MIGFLLGGNGYFVFRWGRFFIFWAVFYFFIFVCDYDWFFIGGSGYFVYRLGR